MNKPPDETFFCIAACSRLHLPVAAVSSGLPAVDSIRYAIKYISIVFF